MTDTNPSAFEEKAREIIRSCEGKEDFIDALVPAISSALAEAREEENEACAGIADAVSSISPCCANCGSSFSLEACADDIAASIRSRTQKETAISPVDMYRGNRL